MKILIGIFHPAHVHTFRNIIASLESDGHQIKVVVVEKDITTQLLNCYNLNYEVIGKSRKQITEKIIDFFRIGKKTADIIREFKPDIILSRGFVGFALLSKIFRIPYVAFVDSDVTWMTRVQLPFIDVIITPSQYRFKLNPRQHIRLNTYKELAYLHPNRFTPNPLILQQAGLSKNENFVLLRFVAWDAYHDVGRRGFDPDSKMDLIFNISKYARVYISSERPLPLEFEQYRLPIRIDQIHDFLYYANLFVCDSQTMATEAAMLGTPTIRCNSFVGVNDMGNFIELEREYGLIFNFSDPHKALEKAEILLNDQDLKRKWQTKRRRLLKEKSDLTAFMVWFIEHYPEGRKIMNEKPDFEKQFMQGN